MKTRRFLIFFKWLVAWKEIHVMMEN